jgi:uncharacterized membrane protein
LIDAHRLHRYFRISVILKGLDALIECVGGVALFVLSKREMVAFVNRVTQEELIEDPHDFIATHLFVIAHRFSVTSKSFYAAYLLGHGIIKLMLVAGLLGNRLWAYPTALIALGGFSIYQLYRFSYTHALGLMALTLFDLFVIGLIWHEWNVRRETRRR